MAERCTADRYATQLVECLRELERQGRELQQALVRRQTDAIWHAIELHEHSLAKFGACYREYESHKRQAAGLPADPSAGGADTLVADLAQRIKRIHRTNRALALSFLDVIDRTIAGLSQHVQSNPLMYDASGRVGRVSAPVLVSQKG